MPTYESAGLYPEERKASAGPVAGVSTSTYASAGWLQKGPTNQPKLISGFDRLVEIFGGYWRNSFLPFMVNAYFNNEGARAYISRVVPTDAVKASNADCLDSVATAAEFITRVLPATVDLSVKSKINLDIDNAVVPADIDCVGAVPAATTREEIKSAIDGVAGVTAVLYPHDVNGPRIKIVSDSTGLNSALLFAETDVPAEDASKIILGLETTPSVSFKYEGEDAIDWSQEAAWEGAWYNQVKQCITGNEDYADAYGGWTRFNVENQEESSFGAGDWTVKESYEAVLFDDDTSDQFAPTVINDQTDYCKITEGATFTTPRLLKAYSRTNECLGEGDAALTSFSGTLLFPVVSEDTLTIVAGAITATDDGEGILSGVGITSGTINYTTGAWALVYDAAPAVGVLIMAAYGSAPVETEVCCQLTNGSDGTGPITRSLISDPALAATKAGIYAFNQIEEILNMSLSDFAGDVAVSGDLITYSENRKDVFAILATAVGVTPMGAKKWLRNTAQYNTSYAALYYPWVTIADPLTDDNRPLNVPPDGFIAGVFSRTDATRNVGKAPAGINEGKLNGCIGLERILEKTERDILYPARINPLMASAQTGRAVWGARTLSLDAEWRYIQTRRLFMYAEKSIENASWWVVFENNNSATWARMLAQGNSFFISMFRDGYLKGDTPADAFKIVIDETNNTEDVIDSGFIIADYYFAGNKPGEFIRLRFAQKIKAA